MHIDALVRKKKGHCIFVIDIARLPLTLHEYHATIVVVAVYCNGFTGCQRMVRMKSQG